MVLFLRSLSVNELFSGIGTQALALEYLNYPHVGVGQADISKNAVRSYNVLHGETHNYGDVSQIEALNYADLWTYSFPCTSLSTAGKQLGLCAEDEEGNRIPTASGLLWEVERLLARACGYRIDPKTNELVADPSYVKEPPMYLLMENVPELLIKKHYPHFCRWLRRLEELGYSSSFGILDGQNFGVAQHRERCFCVSVRRDIYDKVVPFPMASFDTPPVLVDLPSIMEPQFRDYTGPAGIDPNIGSVMMREKLEPCIPRLIALEEAGVRRMFAADRKKGFTRSRVGVNVSGTLLFSNSEHALFHNGYLHNCTGLEAWRLMGIKDEDYYKVKEEFGYGDAQFLALAGNAIVVPCLMTLFYQIIRIHNGLEPETKPPFFTPFDSLWVQLADGSVKDIGDVTTADEVKDFAIKRNPSPFSSL